MRLAIFIEVKIAEKYKEECGAVDRIGCIFEPWRKWDGDVYEKGCDSKEKAKMMENRGDCYSARTVAEMNTSANQNTSEGK
ncbi:hypothetical protein D8674_007213 [Pyrus ussuriensis x Pyrus communis]|uniref:Uncharacterized protein n=1 Tax=Pyrus ussuriensis x Pyrus communis TaxID=2448454 RepID=A0A5N5FWJ1_9ROSA|nr:hypothetical protein D8674_007213 [Pyrus ussuriensis x Pyrus communis]